MKTIVKGDGAFEGPAEAARDHLGPAEAYPLYRPELSRFLLGLLRDHADAEDVLQQVFLKLLAAGDSVQPETLKGWLYTVAYHEAMAVRRRRKVDSAARARLWARPVWEIGGRSEKPDQGVLQLEAITQVRSALDQLPPEQRDVVERRIYRGQTFAVIAKQLGCPLGTVLTRMRLALIKLKELLKE